MLAPHIQTRYNRPVTSKKGVIGFGDPVQFAAKSRNRKGCGFFHSTSYGGADGRAVRPCRFSLRELPGSPTRQHCRPFGDGWQSSNATLEATMASTHAPAPVLGHITVSNGQVTTTTQDIADVYGKRHDDVLRIVRQRMSNAPAEWRLRNFTEASIQRPQTNGGTVSYPIIRMTKKGFHFVVGKFTGAKAVQHQIAFADEFERMEQQIAQGTPSPAADPAHAPRLTHGLGQPVAMRLTPEQEATAYRRAYDLANQAIPRLQQWVFDQLRDNAMAPDGTMRASFDNTLNGCTLDAWISQNRTRTVRTLTNVLEFLAGDSAQLLARCKFELEQLQATGQRTSAPALGHTSATTSTTHPNT